jgi:hypothetical protein
VSTDRVKGHLRSAIHKKTNLQVQQHKLDEALADMEVNKDLPSPPCTTLDVQAPRPYQGLKVLEGFACTLCTQLALSESYLKDHYTREHSNHPHPSQLTQCSMQRFSLMHTGPLRKLFRVQSEALIQIQPAMSVVAVAQQLMAKALQVPRKRGNVDKRSVSPWLLTTKWHEHVHGYDVKELYDLVAFPSKTEFPGLVSTVQEYFSDATEEMQTLQELTLQMLNTADPAKT